MMRVTVSVTGEGGNNDCRGCTVLVPSDSFWLHVLRVKWVERNADGWERSNNATRVCGADRAVESIEPVEPVKLVESVELVEHTTWSGHVQYVWVGVLHGL